MNRKNIGIVLALVLAGTAACGSPPPDPCQINPTWQNSSGEWREADGEPMDADPCDSDDIWEDAGHKKLKKKPTVKKTTGTTAGGGGSVKARK